MGFGGYCLGQNQADNRPLAKYNATDNGSVVAFISKNDLTRIAIDGDRIKALRPSSGNFTLEIDPKNGNGFIMPGVGGINQTITIMMTTEKGKNVRLLFTPMDIPLEQVIIKIDDVLNDNQNKNIKLFGNAQYAGAIAQIFKSIFNNEIPEGFKVKDLGLISPQKGIFTIDKAWENEFVRMELLSYENVLDSEQAVEKEMNLTGALAYWIENSTAKPKSTTYAILMVKK